MGLLLALVSGAWGASPVVTGVVSVNGTYLTGDDIYIDVQFDQTIFLSGGSPTLELELGQNRLASYIGGGDPPAGSTDLTFRYTVQSDDFSADLDYTSQYALEWQGATVTNSAGELASRVLPTPGAAGSLGANNNIVVGEAYLSLSGLQIVEQGGTVEWTVTRFGTTVGGVDVFLTSGNPAVASVPVSVNIAAGDDSATFDVTGVSTGGPVTVQALAVGYAFDTRDVTVISADLVLSLQAVGGGTVIDEGDQPTWRVYRSGPTASSLVVTLTSGDTNVVTLPLTVIIPSGLEFGEFVLQALDGVAGGANVTLTASATAFTDGAALVTILNVDPVLFPTAPPATALQGQTLTFAFTADDVLGDQPVLGTWDLATGIRRPRRAACL